jgi:hypothetical protein
MVGGGESRGTWAARMRGRIFEGVRRCALLMAREVLSKGREMWRSWGCLC